MVIIEGGRDSDSERWGVQNSECFMHLEEHTHGFRHLWASRQCWTQSETLFHAPSTKRVPGLDSSGSGHVKAGLGYQFLCLGRATTQVLPASGIEQHAT